MNSRISIFCFVAGLAMVVGWFLRSDRHEAALHAPARLGAVATEAEMLAVRSSNIRREHRASDMRTDVPDRMLTGSVRSERVGILRGATVCITESSVDPSSAYRCTMTDASGHFQLVAGDVERLLIASAKGHASRLQLVPTSDMGQPVDMLLASAEVALIGKVVDANGGGVAGAMVMVQRYTAAALDGAALTGQTGEFAVAAAPGPTVLSVRAKGYATTTLIATAPADSLTIVIAAGSVLTGQVVDEATGRPVAGIRVSAVANNPLQRGMSETATDKAGRFQMTGLHAADYELSPSGEGWSGEPVSVWLGVGDAVDDIEIRARPAAILTATIKVAGVACAGARVDLQATTPQQGLASLGADADARGVATIRSILPGSYRASVHCPGGMTLVDEIIVGAGAARFEWDLRGGSVARGRIVRAGGQPIAGAFVTVEPSPEAQAIYLGTAASCVSDGDGEFACGGLAPGDYRFAVASQRLVDPPQITISAGDGKPAPVLLRTSGRATLVARIERHHGQIGSFEVLVRNRSGLSMSGTSEPDGSSKFDLPLDEYTVYLGPTSFISESAKRVMLDTDGQQVSVQISAPELRSIGGVVLDSAGLPIADVWVHAESAIPSETGKPLGAPSLTDGEGTFELEGLIPGDYHIFTAARDANRTSSPVSAGAHNVVVRPQSAALKNMASSAPPSDHR